MAHDAIRTAQLLRDIFANDRTRVGFLIGAGCPFSISKPQGEEVGEDAPREPLIPDVKGLTTLAIERLALDHANLHATLLSYLIADGTPDANIETILSKIRALSDIVGNASVHGFDRSGLDQVERSLCATIAEAVSVPLPEGSNGYRSLAGWIKGLSRQYPVEIFTTNYDLLMETALEENFITTFDGFTGSRRPFFDVAAIERGGLPSDWVRLWKVHGSVNWREEDDNGKVCRVCDLDQATGSLIHPSNKKYDQSRRLPYLALMDCLRAFVRQPSAALFVLGYSFGDEHINEIVLEGLENNPTAVVIASQFGNLDRYPVAVELARRSSNFTVMADDHAIVGKKTDSWAFDPQQGGSLHLVFEDAPNEGWNAGPVKFLLGNFAAFGAFVDDVSGSFRQVERVAKA